MKHLDHPIYLVLGEDVQNMPVYKIYSGRVGPDDPWPSPEIAAMWDEPYAVLSYGALDVDHIQFFAGAYGLSTQFSIEGTGGSEPTPPSGETTPGTMFYSSNIGLQPGPWNLNAYIPQFNPGYGTLNTIDLAFNGLVLSAPGIENLDPVPRTLTVGATATLKLVDGTTAFQFLQVSPTTTTSRNVTAFDGTVDFAGNGTNFGSGFIVDPPISADANDLLTLDNSHAEFSFFIGTGTSPLKVQGSTVSIHTGATDIAFYDLPKAGSELVVTYNYTAVGASVTGIIWWDKHQDGVLEVGEAGLAGIEVTLVNDFYEDIATTTTDANGVFNFYDINIPAFDPRIYYVRVTQPNHGEQTYSTAEGFNTNPEYPNLTWVPIEHQQITSGVNFGYRGQPEGYYWLCVPMDSGWSPATITRQSDGSTFPMATAADLGVSTEVNGFGYYVQSDIDDVTYRMFRSKTVIYSGDTDTLIVTT